MYVGLTFSVDFDEMVAMRMAGATRYKLGTSEGAEEWKKLMPSGGHLVHIAAPDSESPKAETHTSTLFHQLKCLDIIREQYISRPAEVPPSGLTRHCMNYLRQIFLCRPALWLESTKNVRGVASRDYDAVCRDWTKVYEEAERNHEAYVKWKNQTASVVG